jgi:hypothetical protein
LSMIVIISNRSEHSERHAGFFLSRSNVSNVKSNLSYQKMPEYKVQFPTNHALTKDTQHHLSVSKSSSDNHSINGR